MSRQSCCLSRGENSVSWHLCPRAPPLSPTPEQPKIQHPQKKSRLCRCSCFTAPRSYIQKCPQAQRHHHGQTSLFFFLAVVLDRPKVSTTIRLFEAGGYCRAQRATSYHTAAIQLHPSGNTSMQQANARQDKTRNRQKASKSCIARCQSVVVDAPDEAIHKAFAVRLSKYVNSGNGGGTGQQREKKQHESSSTNAAAAAGKEKCD